MPGPLDFFIEWLLRIREAIRTFLQETEAAMKRTLAMLALIAGVISISLFVLLWGFPLKPEDKLLIVELIQVVFTIYVFNFFVRWLYADHKLVFLQRRWLEAAIIMVITFDLVSFFFFDTPLFKLIFRQVGVVNYFPYYATLMQLILFILLLIEFVRFSRWLMYLHIRPATMLIASFGVLITAGTFLLLLPEMTVTGRISFIDALFTATSASCVTGLIVVDTATYFTLKGQIVILLLLQLGGIGIVSFATFFVLFLRRGMAIHHQMQLQEQLAQESIHDMIRLLREVLVYTLIIETLGAVLIFLSWGPEVHFRSLGEKIFFSIFHAVSAFCNAGFSLFTDGYYHPAVRWAIPLHMITAGLIILGGLGFPALKDLFSPGAIRERLRLPWKRLKTSTHIALVVSTVLLAAGTIVFFILERNNTLRNMHWGEGLVYAFFQSVTARTAGFNTIDIGAMTTSSLLFMIFLMFVGASSGSTGGGIKTSTFTIITLTVWAVVRNKKDVTYRHRSIPQELQYRAFAILAFSVIIISTALFLISVVEPDKSLRDLAFEVVSAFGTVGLSTGITPNLSTLGKLIIIAEMFIGRVGPLTLAFALSTPSRAGLVHYPRTNIMIG